MTAVGRPLELFTREIDRIEPDQALVRVAGCGVCHTDLGFLHDGVKTKRPLPLTLGHEVSGVVEDAGDNGLRLVGREVVIPAVVPCGRCDACRRGRGTICPAQVFLGNDIDGGFASHVVVPTRALVEVPADRGDIDLADLAVVADAVSTPYQAVKRSGLGPGDLAVFVGAGGVGAFGVQIARAVGATVAAIDIDPERLELALAHGASLALDATATDARAMKKRLRDHAGETGCRATEWRIFETSGTRKGQETAFSLLVPGAYLSIVGYTPEAASVPLSHLMAFDARAEGNWGCLPELYPEALALVVAHKVRIAPFIERRPLGSVNAVLDETHQRKLRRRAVLIPEAAP